MVPSSIVRSAFFYSLVGVALLAAGPTHAQQIASIRSVTGRVFVTGVTPIVGPRGVVGGVFVDAQGVVSRASEDERGEVRAQWQQLHRRPVDQIAQPTKMRMISLRNLDQTLMELVGRGQSPPEEMFFLAGLQRVEYVFVDPDRRDVILAGPAEGWHMGNCGEMVGDVSGQPVLRLDDLMEALRTVQDARETGISCSIEPTEEGLKQYAKHVHRRNLRFNPATVRAIEKAMGPQQVLVTGVDSDGHFARTMVAADYIMKLLAMGFEPPPTKDMPSYLQLLSRAKLPPQISSPRWWMTANYEPLLHSPDRLAWQIRGPGLKTLTEDSVLDARGQRSTSDQVNPVAQQWAAKMTEHIPRLSVEFPALGQLRNCVDLAVVSALIVKRDLLGAADCQLEILLDRQRIRGPIHEVPTAVDSRASFIRGQRGWIVSVSGGVEIDSWSVVDQVEQDESLETTYHEALETTTERWWW